MRIARRSARRRAPTEHPPADDPEKQQGVARAQGDAVRRSWHQSQGPPRLHDRGHLRGRTGAHRHRGEVAAGGSCVPRRRLRVHRGRRGVARCRAHPRVHRGHLEQPRSTRKRKLLLHKAQIIKIQPHGTSRAATRSCPLQIYFSTAVPRSRSRSPRASASTTSARPCASVRTSARPIARCRAGVTSASRGIRRATFVAASGHTGWPQDVVS